VFFAAEKEIQTKTIGTLKKVIDQTSFERKRSAAAFQLLIN